MHILIKRAALHSTKIKSNHKFSDKTVDPIVWKLVSDDIDPRSLCFWITHGAINKKSNVASEV